MIFFPTLRTRRLTLQMQELSIGDAIELASMPAGRGEAEITAFLHGAIKAVEKGPTDPKDWTVQERMMAVAHYLAATTEANFSLGQGRFSDYLLGEIEGHTLEDQSLGEICGDKWTFRQLTGAMAESIERTVGDVDGIPVRVHWLVGAMAFQMVNDGENKEDGAGEPIDDWLLRRMRTFLKLPESSFVELMRAWIIARQKTEHLFRIEYTNEGIVAMPIHENKEGAEGQENTLPPARFPARACIGDWARAMA